MSKNRYINTRFWDDGYITTLDPIEKLLFIYLLTNPLTEICGAYEIPLRRIAFDTGIDKDMVSKILDRFADADRVIYRDGWVLICNFIKHQNANSPTIKTGIEKGLSCCPDWIKDRLCITYGYGIDTLSHLNLNSNLNMNSNSNSNENAPTTDEEPLFDSALFDYPVRELIEAFPQVNFQPTHFGFIESEIGDTPLDRSAWLATIQIYQQNHDPRNNVYMPTKVGNLLGVFRRERTRIEREEKYATGKSNSKRTDADVFKESADFYANYPEPIA